MITPDKFAVQRSPIHPLLFTIAILILFMLVGCSSANSPEEDSRPEEPAAVDYTPLAGENWEVSSPEAQGLEAEWIAELYEEAAELETLYSLLVVKDGYLIAEQYFNGGSVGKITLVQSATKSFMSALAAIAVEEGCLTGLDQKLLEFFPEVAGEVQDPRKREVTLRQLLQMRSGYPDEETDAAYMEALYWGVYPPLIVEFPLVNDPGADFNYSNLSYSWLAILLERACGPDLMAFAQQHLFDPLEAELGDWLKDREGHYIGSGGMHMTARDAAQFGLLYLREGAYQGQQVVPADWVRDSLVSYSDRARDYGWGFAFGKLGYGYGWWTASPGGHEVRFAWGHGGQLIVLLDELDMVIVTTADPFFGQHDGESWKHEKATLNLVGNFIKSLPGE